MPTGKALNSDLVSGKTGEDVAHRGSGLTTAVNCVVKERVETKYYRIKVRGSRFLADRRCSSVSVLSLRVKGGRAPVSTRQALPETICLGDPKHNSLTSQSCKASEDYKHAYCIVRWASKSEKAALL